MTDPADIAARYHEVHVDDDDRASVIRDRATGETVLIFGNRRWQRLVLQSLNLADQKLERIGPGERTVA